MKLPITDQFLLKLFYTIQRIDAGYDFFTPRTMKEALCPELFAFRRKIRRAKEWKSFSQLVYHLKQRGYISIHNLKNKKGVMLTPKGAQKVLKIQLETGRRQKRKDGKWQMVIFDIPEEERPLREILRQALVDFGYQRLQDSVWVCPYQVEKETEFIIRTHSIDAFVRMFLIEEIEV